MSKRKFILSNLGWLIVIIIIAIFVIAGVHGKNQALNEQLEELKNENLDLQIELSDYPGEIGQLYLYIEELENENQILGSCCASGDLNSK